jgi:hypothetical protein
VWTADCHEAPDVGFSAFGLEPGAGCNGSEGVANNVHRTELRMDPMYNVVDCGHDVGQVTADGRVGNALDVGNAAVQQVSGQIA